jgi:hypothetical protein
MARCYDAVSCWVMPTWRVAEQLPADLDALGLVIIDEASQSDVTELTALLGGRKECHYNGRRRHYRRFAYS